MSTPLVIWGSAALLYGLFWSWYVGFGRRCDPAAIDKVAALATQHGFDETQVARLRAFFEGDNGKPFVMVNLLHFKEPRDEARAKLEKYQKIFLGDLLKRAGHPIYVGRAVGGNIEDHGEAGASGWQVTGLVRYRSRADLLAVLPKTMGSDHHRLKLEALLRTFAFPAETLIQPFGVTTGVALILALGAALIHLVV